MADAVADEPPREEAGARHLRPFASLRKRAPGGLRRRFGLAYFVLAIVFGAAAGFFVVFLQEGSKNVKAAAWSPWRPTAEGSQAFTQIADYVARHYRLPSGSQLVGVIAGSPKVQDVPISAIAVRSGFAEERPDDIKVFNAKNSIMYILCGLGQQCSIPEGKPSPARAQLLRREALELALYTFRYVGHIDSVLAFIPPPPGSEPKATIFLRRDELGPQLQAPLRKTLPIKPRLLPGRLAPRELATVDKLTGTRIFQYQFQQVPDGTAILVLAPPAL